MRIVQMILTFDDNANLLNFTEKLKTASGKYGLYMVMWSFLPFAVNVINLSLVRTRCTRKITEQVV